MDLNFIDVTKELFIRPRLRHTSGWQATHSTWVRSAIRGPDHVFLSCALAKRAPLVTWDGTILAQAHRFGVAVITPEDYVAGRPVGTTAPVPDTQTVLDEFTGRTRGKPDTHSSTVTLLWTRHEPLRLSPKRAVRPVTTVV